MSRIEIKGLESKQKRKEKEEKTIRESEGKK